MLVGKWCAEVAPSSWACAIFKFLEETLSTVTQQIHSCIKTTVDRKSINYLNEKIANHGQHGFDPTRKKGRRSCLGGPAFLTRIKSISTDWPQSAPPLL
jgi:hypothetical protein